MPRIVKLDPPERDPDMPEPGMHDATLMAIEEVWSQTTDQMRLRWRFAISRREEEPKRRIRLDPDTGNPFVLGEPDDFEVVALTGSESKGDSLSWRYVQLMKELGCDYGEPDLDDLIGMLVKIETHDREFNGRITLDVKHVKEVVDRHWAGPLPEPQEVKVDESSESGGDPFGNV